MRGGGFTSTSDSSWFAGPLRGFDFGSATDFGGATLPLGSFTRCVGAASLSLWNWSALRFGGSCVLAKDLSGRGPLYLDRVLAIAPLRGAGTASEDEGIVHCRTPQSNLSETPASLSPAFRAALRVFRV